MANLVVPPFLQYLVDQAPQVLNALLDTAERYAAKQHAAPLPAGSAPGPLNVLDDDGASRVKLQTQGITAEQLATIRTNFARGIIDELGTQWFKGLIAGAELAGAGGA